MMEDTPYDDHDPEDDYYIKVDGEVQKPVRR